MIMKKHTVQTLVNMTVANFRKPGSGLPRCDVCDIFIGNDMSDVHAAHPEHLKRLSAQQGFFK